MRTIVAVLALIAVALAATPGKKPNLNDSFFANVQFHENFGQSNFSIYGSWYVDFVGRQHSFRTTDPNFGAMGIYRYYNTSRQYEFYVDSGFCDEQMNMRMFFFGTFDFLSRAKATGNCADRHGNQGIVWTATIMDKPGMNLQLDLCAAPSGNIPFMVTMMGQFNYQSISRTVEFFGYYPGVPAPQYFQLPQQCQ